MKKRGLDARKSEKGESHCERFLDELANSLSRQQRHERRASSLVLR